MTLHRCFKFIIQMFDRQWLCHWLPWQLLDWHNTASSAWASSGTLFSIKWDSSESCNFHRFDMCSTTIVMLPFASVPKQPLEVFPTIPTGTLPLRHSIRVHALASLGAYFLCAPMVSQYHRHCLSCTPNSEHLHSVASWHSSKLKIDEGRSGPMSVLSINTTTNIIP